MGSIESGLVVTTINPGYTSEEISRQLSDCQPKAIFCLVDNYGVVKNACDHAKQPNIKIIAIKANSTDSLPSGAIDFSELTNAQGDFNLINQLYYNKNDPHIKFYSRSKFI